MNLADAIPLVLLVMITIVVSAGMGLVISVRRSKKFPPGKSSFFKSSRLDPSPVRLPHLAFLKHPSSWLAVRSRSLATVQSALGLHRVKPCLWIDGLAGEEKLFLAPPLDGWILVFGSGLPEPADDVDKSFRFLLNLSCELGEVQYFNADRVLHHHAWVRAEGGRIIRAYAWADGTLWQQGRRTAAEIALGLRCFDYTEPGAAVPFTVSDAVSANVERVPLLAGRWSLDPADIDERLLTREFGIAGEPSRRY